MLVRKCSRPQYLNFLYRLTTNGVQPGMLPFVDVVAVTALHVEPFGPQSSWNVDGELLQVGEASVEGC